MAQGDVIQSSHRFHGPCSACGDGDTAMEYHGHDNPRLRPPYTLAEIKQLAQEYLDDATSAARLNDRLRLSLFLAWLARREQGKEADDVRRK